MLFFQYKEVSHAILVLCFEDKRQTTIDKEFFELYENCPLNLQRMMANTKCFVKNLKHTFLKKKFDTLNLTQMADVDKDEKETFSSFKDETRSNSDKEEFDYDKNLTSEHSLMSERFSNLTVLKCLHIFACRIEAHPACVTIWGFEK